MLRHKLVKKENAESYIQLAHEIHKDEIVLKIPSLSSTRNLKNIYKFFNEDLNENVLSEMVTAIYLITSDYEAFIRLPEYREFGHSIFNIENGTRIDYIEKRLEKLEKRLDKSIILEDISCYFKENEEFLKEESWINEQKSKNNDDIIAYTKTDDGWKLLAHAKDEKSVVKKIDKMIKKKQISKEEIIYYE